MTQSRKPQLDISQHPLPWLSVLIPVYNSDRYLEECLTSVLSQDAAGIEIILVDDGSTDGSAAICEHHVDTYPDQIRYIKMPTNQGISAARNHLLDAARGDYIWYIDSDDFALPGSLNSIKAVIDKNDPDMILVDYMRNQTKHKSSFSGPSGTLAHDNDALIRGVFESRKLYCWQKITRTKIWRSARPFPDGKMFEDVSVIPDVLTQVKSYYYLPQACLNYRVRKDSLMGSIARTKGNFDISKHADLISAVQSLSDALAEPKVSVSGQTEFSIAHFIAREFIKTAKRFQASDKSAQANFTVFKASLNHSSPISFETLLGRYLRQGKVIAYYNLARALRV